MSGVSSNRSSDWHDQLSHIKADMSEDAIFGGFVSNRHSRKGRSANRRERDPFEGARFNKEVSSITREVSDDSIIAEGDKASSVIGASFQSDRDYVSVIGNGAEDVMSKNERDQSSFGDEDLNQYSTKESRGRSKRVDRETEGELTEEEIAYQKRMDAKSAVIRKASMWGLLTAAVGVTATCGAAVVCGLLGRHRSNINNM